jgi:hypothetical protein
MADKRTKAETHYRAGTDARNCAACMHYDGGSCDRVAGRIGPKMVCDLYVAAPRMRPPSEKD